MTSLQSILLMLAVLTFSASLANAAPQMVKQFNGWGLFSYKDKDKTVCYVLSEPSLQEPQGINHGKNYFMVAPKGNKAFYPQAVIGYETKPGADLDVSIGDHHFSMVVKDKSGWTKQEADDRAVVSAMQTGHDLVVHAVSKRGTKTQYTYDLKGFTQALKQAATCK